MSFWMEDDDDPFALGGVSQGTSRSLSQNTNNNNNFLSQGTAGTGVSGASQDYPDEEEETDFLCQNCGGTEYYDDKATDSRICALCNTASQGARLSQLGPQEEADFDDIEGLAGRSGGRIKFAHGVPGARGASGRREAGSKMSVVHLQHLDRSKPFPDLTACITGFQNVVYESVERVVDLIVEHCRQPDVEDSDSDDSEEKEQDDAFSLKSSPSSSDRDESDEGKEFEGEQSKRQSIDMDDGSMDNNSHSVSRDDGRMADNGDGVSKDVTTTGDQYRDSIHRTVRTLWMSYLRAWGDGAAYYGQKYPHARFSLRDKFLAYAHRTMINNSISYHVVQKHKNGQVNTDDENENDEENDEESRVGDGSDDSDNENDEEKRNSGRDEESDEERSRGRDKSTRKRKRKRESSHEFSGDADVMAPETSSSFHPSTGYEVSVPRKRLNASYFVRQNNAIISKIIHAHAKAGDPVTHREAALNTAPSMYLVAALVWLSVCHVRADGNVYEDDRPAVASKATRRRGRRSGKHQRRKNKVAFVVTSDQMCEWIANGSLPLQNAFAHLLKPKQRSKLEPIKSFFICEPPPTPYQLEMITNQLAIACRLKTSSDLVSSLKRTNGHRFRGEPFALRAGGVTKRSAPIIAAQICADLGLGQETANRCFALMGISRDVIATLMETTSSKVKSLSDSSTEGSKRDKQLLLPKRMKSANPVRLFSMIDVVAVVGIACFLDPNWRSWTFVRRTRYEGGANHNREDAKSSRHLHRQDVTREVPQQERSVPFNETQLRALQNGPALEGYLDFVNQSVLDESKSVISGMLKVLPRQDLPTTKNKSAKKSTENSYSNGSHCDEMENRRTKIPNDSMLFPVLAGGRHPLEKEERMMQCNHPEREELLETFCGLKPPKQPNSNPTRVVRSRHIEIDPQKRALIEVLAYAYRIEPDRLQAVIDRMLQIR